MVAEYHLRVMDALFDQVIAVLDKVLVIVGRSFRCRKGEGCPAEGVSFHGTRKIDV